MCKVSDKIKFCTCGTSDLKIEELENYWILYRYNDNNVLETEIGLFYKVVNIEFDSTNKNTILKRLQESDAFDIPIQFKNDDSLVVYLNQNIPSEELNYCFKFIDGQWDTEEYNPFSIHSTAHKFKSGYLENALESKG